MKVNWRRSCRIGVEEVVGVVSNTLGRSGCYTFLISLMTMSS